MSFLPENYEAPKASNQYMKLQDGENRIRILSRAVTGWEDWQDKKPLRFEMSNKPQKPLDPTKPIKHFWAFIVYNYNESRIQILELTQATIRKSIEALSKDEDWGMPYDYDIKIVKVGENINTEYAVNPVPHKIIDKSIVDAFNASKCNLDALFEGADPFAEGWSNYEELKSKYSTEKSQESEISDVELENMEKLLDRIPEFKNVKTEIPFDDLRKLSRKEYAELYANALSFLNKKDFEKKEEDYNDDPFAVGQ